MRSVRPVERVEHSATGRELAGVDAEVGQLADVGIGHHLEGEGGEGGAVVGGALGLGRAAVVTLLRGLEPLDGRDLERRGEQLDDRVEQRLHALVLEGGAAEDGRHLDVERGAVERLRDPLVRDLLVVQVRLEQLVVVVGAGLDQVGAVLVSELLEVLGDLLVVELGAQLVLPDERLVLDQVDDAYEVRLLADRDLDRQRVGAEPVAHGVDGVEEVRAGAIHLVDVGHARDVVLVGLAPDRLGLRLDPGDGVEERDRAVQDAEVPLHLDGEVDVPRRVEDVDAVVVPIARGRRRGDRDAALLLLLHPVHDGSALVDLAHLVSAARVVEDSLCGRRLTGIDVGDDADVARLV